MATPISFPSTTQNYALPLLFSGQAQKEFFLNQALSVVDALLQRRVEQVQADPPSDPAEGSCYIVASPATGEWAGKEDDIAVRIGGEWHFITPRGGETLFDAGSGALIHYDSGWSSPVEPVAANGGTTIDAEARQMLNELVEALKNAGIFAKS